jgi:cbb3-type cytochrome oxidase subunit 3
MHMVWWILMAAVVVGLAVFAFWPRRRAIDDRRARSAVNTFQGKVEQWNNDRGNIGGGL